jgi:hypothetical protein
MPRLAAGAKRPVAKGPALKEVAAKQVAVKSSARKRVTQDKENHHPVMAAPTSASASTPVNTRMANQNLASGATPMPDIIDDEISMLRGEYFGCALFNFFFF